jgi:hypothetical protein
MFLRNVGSHLQDYVVKRPNKMLIHKLIEYCSCITIVEICKKITRLNALEIRKFTSEK